MFMKVALKEKLISMVRTDFTQLRNGSDLLKRGFARMQQGGVIMDVVDPEQAAVAEDAGAAGLQPSATAGSLYVALYTTDPTDADSGTSWIGVEFVDVVAHLFEPTQRAFYVIEGLWTDAPRLAWRAAAATSR